MRWQAFGLAVSAALAANAACATPISVEYVQETLYDLTYYAPGLSILLNEHQPTMEIPFYHYDASYHDEADGYMTTFSHTVVESGLRPLSLSGESIIFSSMGSRGYGNSWYDGTISFDENNAVVDWEFYFVETVPVTVLVSSSQGREIDLSLYQPLHDGWQVEGRTIYDQWLWEPSDAGYSTRPGWWSVSVGHSCYTTVNGEYQASVSCTAPTPVPLPLPGLALMGAIASLAGIGTTRAWRRRTVAAAL